MVVLDTSACILFLTKDNLPKAYKVKMLFEMGELINIPDAVLPELEYVLVKKGSFSRSKLILALSYFFSHPNIILSPEAKNAILLYKDTTLDMADCLVGAAAYKGRLASFDKKLLSLKHIKAYWKA